MNPEMRFVGMWETSESTGAFGPFAAMFGIEEPGEKERKREKGIEE